jgi:hypothetical protein
VALTLAIPSPAATLFHTATGTAFIDIEIEGHRETWPVRGKQLRAWLRRRYYDETGGALAVEIIRPMLDLLEAHAQFDASERTVHVRVAEHEGRIYLDLVDKERRAVEITPDGWRVIGSPPVSRRHAAAPGTAEGRIPECRRQICANVVSTRQQCVRWPSGVLS